MSLRHKNNSKPAQRERVDVRVSVSPALPPVNYEHLKPKERSKGQEWKTICLRRLFDGFRGDSEAVVTHNLKLAASTDSLKHPVPSFS